MSNKGVFMTQTVQHGSRPLLSGTGGDLTINKLKTEDDNGHLFRLLESLDALYEILSKLERVIKRKNTEMRVHRKNKGETK
jgi:hypothetical protein